MEQLSWNTEILTSFDLTEQRAGWRVTPKRTFQYDFLINHADLPFVEAIIYALQGSEVEVELPVWTDSKRLDADLAAGSGTIPLETDGLDYGSPGKVAILTSESVFEVLDVESFSSTELVLVKTTGRLWPRGSRVVPVRSGIMPLSITLNRPTDQGTLGSIQYELTDPGWPVLPALVADTYRSLDVFPFTPDRSEAIGENYTVVRTRFESMGGTVVVLPRRDRPAINTTPRFVFSGRDEIQQFRAWLYRSAGQRKRFWMPSFMTSLELAKNAGSADEWIVVQGVRGHELYGHPHGPETELDAFAYRNPGRRDVQIVPSFGATPIRRRIQSWHQTAEGYDQLLLDSALGVDLVAGTARVSWLSEHRFASDQLELRWLTDDKVETNLPIRSL